MGHSTFSPLDIGSETLAVRGGRSPDPLTGAILPPIVQSTAFAQAEVGGNAPFAYSRVGNPTVSALEGALAAFEGVPHCSCYSSGLSALTTLFLSLLKAGDHVVCGKVVYGGTTRLLQQYLAGLGIDATFADSGDPEAFARAFTERTRLAIIETPGNPTLTVTDIAASATIAHEHDALLVVDNTFLTAALQRPAQLGADIVLYSTTKYIDGHNATVGGAILTDDHDLHQRFLHARKSLGTIGAPLDAFLTLQGLKTLPIRIERQSESASRIARWLSAQAGVRRVHYPLLPGSAQRELAERQQRTGGGIVSFEVDGGLDEARRLLSSLRLCTLAENLGAVETLITHPATMTHADVPREQREACGVPDTLIRLSVGLENVSDIILDLEQAIGAAVGAQEVAA